MPAEQNIEFKSWTRTVAFNLSLSSFGIDNLLLMDFYEKQHAQKKFNYEYSGFLLKPMESSYLQRRGLAERCKKVGYENCWVLSAAGHHVCELLLMAGFKTELHEMLEEKTNA